MFKQIRSLLSEPDMQLEGSAVEIDEAHIGGKPRLSIWVSVAAPVVPPMTKLPFLAWWNAVGA
jgi:hypothetical protein